MNLAESFSAYLATIVGATSGQTLFIGDAPSSNQVADSIWWIKTSGGSRQRLRSGESVKQYAIEVYYRSTDYQTVYDEIHDLEEALNSAECPVLSGYTVIDVEAFTFPIDLDLDSEDRKVGLLQVNITTHKE